ncbi:hypothetical protein, partial [Helicobacter marmotae]
TLTTLTNNGNITNLTNSGTLTTLNNNQHIHTYTSTSNNATTYSSNNGTGYITNLNHSGTGALSIADSLYIGRNQAKTGSTGSLTNSGTITATNAIISIYGSLDNSGTIDVQHLILTQSSLSAQMASKSGTHINGTINNGTQTTGGASTTKGANLTLTNWSLELTQLAQNYNDNPGANSNNQKYGLDNDNTKLSTSNDTKGHILLNNGITLDTLTITERFDSNGNVTNTEAGILISAGTDKWGKKYNYDALFLSNDSGALSTLLKEIQDSSGNVVNKTNEYGELQTDKAENLGGSVTLKLEAARSLYTSQSTVKIFDLKDGFSVGLEPEGSPIETISKGMLNGIISKNMLISNLIDSMSRRIFHNTLNGRKSSEYFITSKSINEDGKRVKNDSDIIIPSKYNNIELLEETDMIYAPHAKDSSFQSFIQPFTRYTTTNLAAGYKGVESNSGLILGTFIDLKSKGSLGLYGGYESGSSSLPRSTGSAEIKNANILLGGHYYKTLFTHGLKEFYVKTFINAQSSNPDLTLHLNTINSSAQKTLSAYGVDVDMKFGANLYNIYANSYISPEFGLGYSMFAIQSFTLEYNSPQALDELYPQHIFKLPYTSAQIHYLKALSPKLRYSFLIGGKYILQDKQSTSVQIGNHSGSAPFFLPNFLVVSGGNLLYSLGSGELALQYDGAFSKDQLNHVISLRYGIWF